MKKYMIPAAVVAVLVVGLIVCLLVGGKPSLPKLDLHTSELTGVVIRMEEQMCQVQVTVGDSHYRGPYENANGETVEGKTVWVTYDSARGTVTEGCTVRFSYSYTADVSEYLGSPMIRVDSVTVK